MTAEPPARRFVDVHAHVVPSGDDGAGTVEEGVALCRVAHETGTRVLFATPHVHAPWDSYPWTPARARLYEASFVEQRARVAPWGLDLRRGREVYPSEALEHDPDELRLEGTEAVLVEFPGWWVGEDDALGLTTAACVRIAEAGLVPVLAHPERSRPIAQEPTRAVAFAERGWPLCLNATSLTERPGGTAHTAALRLLELGVAGLVASDAHGWHRPPRLDQAFAVVVGVLGAESTWPLFDGSALPGLRVGT
ncbi:MAG: CpsB/CapC family capsule biosynthesis tyrosine phosphatase [Gaiella sp.]